MILAVACAHHIAEPVPVPVPILPDPVGPSALTVCWIEFAHGIFPPWAAVARALDDRVESTQSALLLVHPSGTWLLDGGMSVDVEAELDELRFPASVVVRQAAGGWVRVTTPADAVRDAGHGPLTAAVPTHAHFDHLGGLLDLPDVPIVLPAAEIELAASGHRSVMPAEARALPARARPLAFDGPPFLAWPASHDLFGDGSAVLFPMPGHTPGSVGARVRLPDGRAVLLVGDTVWVREGFEQREPKGWIAAPFDHDRDATDRQIQQLWALHRADPSLLILPAHDRRSWVEAFRLPQCLKPDLGD